MKRVLAAAVMALALVGCGGPLEDDGTDVTGATQQELTKPDGPKGAGPELNKNLIRNRQGELLLIPAFQEQMHLTDPIRGDCNK